MRALGVHRWPPLPCPGRDEWIHAAHRGGGHPARDLPRRRGGGARRVSGRRRVGACRAGRPGGGGRAPRDGRGHEDGDRHPCAFRRCGPPGVRAAEQPGQPGRPAGPPRSGRRWAGAKDRPQNRLRRRQGCRRARRRTAGLQRPGPAERRQGRPEGAQARRSPALSGCPARAAIGGPRVRPGRAGSGPRAPGVRAAGRVAAARRRGSPWRRRRPAPGVRGRAGGVRPPVRGGGRGRPVAQFGAVPVQVPPDARITGRRSAGGVPRAAPVGSAALSRVDARADACPPRRPAGALQGTPAQRSPGARRTGRARTAPGHGAGAGAGQPGVSPDHRAADCRRAGPVPGSRRPRAGRALPLRRAAGVRTDARRRAGPHARPARPSGLQFRRARRPTRGARSWWRARSRFGQASRRASRGCPGRSSVWPSR